MEEGLQKSVRYLKGIGPKKAKDFARLGIETLYDALFDFPFRYDDLSLCVDIGTVQPGQKVTVRGTISVIKNRKSTQNRRMMITEAMVRDETGSIQAVWFHQGFLTKTLKVGTLVSLAGKVDDRYGLSLVNPQYEILGSSTVTKHTGRIVPMYSLTSDLTQKVRRRVVEEAMTYQHDVKDWMPEEILARQKLLELHEAIRIMHYPNSMDEQGKALNRLKFDEFFLHHLLYAKVRRELQQQTAPAIPFQEKPVKKFIASLPFTLTDAQRKAMWAVMRDMEKTTPMNRLLEGDVGTGKTLVAAAASWNAASQGWQSAILAPTEILADQHEKTMLRFAGSLMSIAIFTRTKHRVNGKEVTKKQLLDALKNGKIDFIVGTHALLSDEVLFNRLGLIVVDEQHRFGVKQRKTLKDREGDENGIPHLLSMTATPIPRSLALVLYGDLDRSLLDEYPVGRKPILTRLIEPEHEEDAYEEMRVHMDAGRQIFVVCPLIEESDALGAKSVEEIFGKFSSGPFEQYRLGMLHGKLKTVEKDEEMKKFVSGETQMLISTTVIEVGVDVPNATIMYIEGAERFGLAQLHQLRGRVGRGKEASICYLHPSNDFSPLARERLKTVVRSQNGFELADKDLQLRGPGNIFGLDQSGFDQFKLGTIADIDLITTAREEAKTILDEDPEFDNVPLLGKRVRDYIEEVHFE
ncbi:MAG: ATP-dependent DNA helicase RecG [Patescibacteria group bacterium]|jgi:ATP-dependent DNA helicase RecG